MRQTFEDEYMDRMRRRYAKARTRADKTKLIDEAIKMCNLSRKFVIRLLNGSYRYHPHCRRAPTYSQESRRTLVRIWLAMGQMCPLYLHAVMDSAIRDYAEAKASIPEAIADELRRMSVSTITRIIRPHRLVTNKANKRSGSKVALAAQIPAGPGRLDETGEPGVLQVDTVALCGGDMRESFFWIVHVTDAATQWTACAPTWNRGAEATCQALDHIFAHLPFAPKVIHIDNGNEFINHHLLAYLSTHLPNVRLTRSRPYRKNDNNRIEQKNGSVIRALFGDLRFDDHAQLAPLTALCDQWNLLHNLAIPCRRQVAHHRHVTSRGITHTRAFDRPQTPWQRLNALRPQPPPPHINAIQLRRTCERTLNHLYLTQKP